MWETVRIIEKLKPKYVIWENVKNLLSQKHRHNFDAYLQIMEEMGYTNYYKVLNAKDYGIPQNRERVFTISVKKFKFPEPKPLELRLKDILEDEVDEKYFLSDTGKLFFENQANKRGETLTNCTELTMITAGHGQSQGSSRKAEICPTLDTQFSSNWRGVLLEPNE